MLTAYVSAYLNFLSNSQNFFFQTITTAGKNIFDWKLIYLGVIAKKKVRILSTLRTDWEGGRTMLLSTHGHENAHF